MADLIDRDAVLREAEKAYRYEDARGKLAFAIHAIKNYPSVNRWIPCSERLPVLYVPVMILTDDASYAIAYVTENEDEYLWFGDGGHYSKDYVRFWMPLPEPPEEE